ncbi:MAG TPA: hemin uptake protein HemP [Gemmataceae bacterium]|nr:hemin uptake protein HemP [Gemmataceae bacterium]
MVEANEPAAQRGEQRQSEAIVVLDARKLLQGRKEVWIEHGGVRYRLRVTRRNKLILQK